MHNVNIKEFPMIWTHSRLIENLYDLRIRNTCTYSFICSRKRIVDNLIVVEISTYVKNIVCIIIGIEFKYFVDKLDDLFSQHVRKTQGCYINYLDVEILLLHQNFMCVGGKDITCTTAATIAINILAYHTSWLLLFHKNHLIRLHDISSKGSFRILSINSLSFYFDSG